MKSIKKFFSITESYKFEIWDLTSIITVLNVTLILIGYWWAPILGIINCIICLTINVKNRLHINGYVTQVALIILNIYFLTL